MKAEQLMLAALMAATTNRNLLYPVKLDPEQTAMFAADSDNILFTVTSPVAAAAAAATLGTREIWIAPLNEEGVANPEDFILLGKLRAGDTGPTPEAVTEDTTYDNGVVVSNQTGVNNGAKTWDVEGSADEPVIALLINHSRTFGSAAKKGKALAYIAFNEDRSSFSGSAKVNTASSPREGSHRWTFNVAYETVNLRLPAQNPVAGATNIPAVSDLTPDRGPVATVVTVRGVSLNVVTSVRLGAQTIDAAQLTQTENQLEFAVPAGATPGAKVVDLVYADGEVYGGSFTVTAA